MVNEGGPSPAQVCCRVTKTSTGQILAQDDYIGEAIGFREPMKDGPHHIVTEFWYLEANQVETYQAGKKKLPPHLQVPGLAITDSGCRNSVLEVVYGMQPFRKF